MHEIPQEMSVKPKSSCKAEDIEIDPDAWERFEHAVDVVIKSGPKHRTTKENMPTKDYVRNRGPKVPNEK